MHVRNKEKTGVWIGTSGWTYDGWRGLFYPTDLPKKAWLDWYALQFPSTEVNFSFYRTPSLEAVTAWRKATPPGFLFAWKASRFITHWKRLHPDTCQNSIDLMVTRLKALKQKAGPVLFQLPPQFESDCDRLARFLGMLPIRILRQRSEERSTRRWAEADGAARNRKRKALRRRATAGAEETQRKH